VWYAFELVVQIKLLCVMHEMNFARICSCGSRVLSATGGTFGFIQALGRCELGTLLRQVCLDVKARILEFSRLPTEFFCIEFNVVLARMYSCG
jgi:hypothetical protein